MRLPLASRFLRAAPAAVLTCALGTCKGDAGTAPPTAYAYDLVVERREGTSGAPDLYVLDLGTGGERRLLATGLGGMQPAASLDGANIAFVRADAEFNSEIFVVDRNGANPRNVSNNAEADVMPAWSPNGQRLAFVTDRAGVQDIFVVNADGTGLRRLTPTDPSPAVTFENWPAWSPNGQLVAYSSTIDGTPDIWTIAVDAQTVTLARLTGTVDADTHPTWSPTGDRIAFERRDATTGDADIAILTLATGVVEVIRRPGQQINPSWSPLGDLIAFSSNEDGGGDFEVYTMAADDHSNVVRRTNNGLNDLRPTWLKRQ
jgi:Tol biopolymer transport system component